MSEKNKLGGRKNLYQRHPILTLLATNLLLVIGLMSGMEYILSLQNKSGNVDAEFYVSNDPTNMRALSLREFPPHLNVSTVPKKACVIAKDGGKKKTYQLRTDMNGFILPGGQHQEPDIKIAFLGGSTTANRWVEEDKRFTYLVGKLLEKRTGLAVNAYNVSRSGNHSMHSNLALTGKVIPLRPQLAVLMHCINDLSTMVIIGDYWSGGYHRGLVYRIDDVVDVTTTPSDWCLLLTGLKNLTFPNIWERFGNLVQISLSDGLRTPYINIHHEFKARRGQELRINRKAILTEFRSSLQTFVEICCSWGIIPVLMTQPNTVTLWVDNDKRPSLNNESLSEFNSLEKYYNISPKRAAEVYIEMNQVIREVSRQKQILLIDLDKLVPLDYELFYNAFHLSETGCVMVSKAISNHLAPKIIKINKMQIK